MLEIRLLGQFDVRLNGADVKIASRQAQALLAYLALQPGKPNRREKLSGLIWPEATEDNARTYLRQALWRLRKAIGDSYLTSDRMTISFISEADFWLDAAKLTSEPDSGWTADSLITAVSVYEGDLLPGFYEDWVSLERERLLAIFNRRMDGLLKALETAARWKELLVWGERWIAMGSAPEPAYRGLMKAHAALADLTSMTAVYRRCVETLEAELGVEPSEETQALFEQLSRGELPGQKSETAGYAPSKPREIAQPAFLQDGSESTNQESLFIGREGELKLLDTNLKKALAGQGRVVFITGEAGQGKSTLLQEFARRAQAANPELIVASGACPVYTPVCAPYGLFREVLKMLTGDVESAWAAGTISREQAQRLWQMLPEVLEGIMRHSPHLIDSLVSAEGLVERARAASASPKVIERLQAIAGRSGNGNGRLSDQGALFAEFSDFLVSLSHFRPILIILDDLHWSDPSSIGLIGHLGHRLAESAILLLGAYRPEEIIQSGENEPHPLAAVLSEYKRRHGQVVISLDDTEMGDGRFFIDTLLDKEANALDESFRQAFTRHTDGHPLFTIELLREMQERGTLIKNESGEWVVGPDFDWDVVPPRVEGVIETRMSHLDQELRQWLEMASVEGKAFTAEVIAHILGIDARQVVNRMSRELDRQYHLVTAQGIRRQVNGQRHSNYQFRHHLFQQYLYNQLDTIERSYLHQQIGETLEQLFEGQTEEIADLLAHHFQMSGMVEKTIRYLIQAGDFATRVYAYEDAGVFYKQALSHAKEQGKNGRYHQELSNIYLKLGRTLEHISDTKGALTVYEEMEKVGRSSGNQSLLLKALTARGIQYAIPTSAHNPKKAQTVSEEALKLVQQIDDKTAESKILWNLMTAYEYDNQVSKAIEFGERALELSRELNDQRQIAYTLNDLGGCYWVAGQITRAKTLYKEAVEIWRRLQNQPMLSDVLFQFSQACMFGGDYDKALELSDEAWQISQATKNKWGLAYSRSMIGFIYRARGEPGRGIEISEDSLETGITHDLPLAQIFASIELAFSYAQLGLWEQGLKIANQALSVANKKGPSYRPFVQAAIAQNYLVGGDFDNARTVIQAARSDPYWRAFPVHCIAPVLVDGRLALAEGEYGRVLEVGQELLEQLQQFGVRSFLPELHDLLGQALAKLDHMKEARDHFLAGRRVAEAMDAKGHLWPILFHLSWLETDETAATNLRDEAREIVEYVADHCRRPTFRDAFLTNIQAVLEELPRD